MTQVEIEFNRPREGVTCVVPDADTQCGKLLRAMREGVRLTIWNAMVDYGCGALHQRIGELKKMGWPVQREEVVRNGKRVAEFSLETA